jgi:hypothetical protein
MAKPLKADRTKKRGKNKKANGSKPAGDPGSAGVETAPIASGSNVTDDTIREFYSRALAAMTDLEVANQERARANSVYRGVLKAAKKAGIDPADIIWRLSQRNRTTDEIDLETKRRNRLAMLTNLPLGTQLGMFDDGTTVATAIEKGASGEEQTPTRDAAEEQGYQDGKLGKNNRTHYERWPDVIEYYDNGIARGTAENVAKLGGKAPEGATAH